MAYTTHEADHRFDYLVQTAMLKFNNKHGEKPTCLFLGPSYQRTLRHIMRELFSSVKTGQTITLQTYRDLTIYPIETDVLLVGIAVEP